MTSVRPPYVILFVSALLAIAVALLTFLLSVSGISAGIAAIVWLLSIAVLVGGLVWFSVVDLRRRRSLEYQARRRDVNAAKIVYFVVAFAASIYCDFVFATELARVVSVVQ